MRARPAVGERREEGVAVGVVVVVEGEVEEGTEVVPTQIVQGPRSVAEVDVAEGFCVAFCVAFAGVVFAASDRAFFVSSTSFESEVFCSGASTVGQPDPRGQPLMPRFCA